MKQLRLLKYYLTLLHFLIMILLTFAFMEIELQQVEQINGFDIADFTNFKVKRIDGSRTRGLVGNFTYFVPIDNSYTTTYKFFKKQGGEYRLTPYRLPVQGVCDFIQQDQIFLPELAKVSNWPYPTPCPLENKTYIVKGFVPSLKKLPMAMLQTGDYQIEGSVNKGEETVLKANVQLSIINI